MPQNMQYVDGRMELSYEDTKCDKMYHFCWQKLKRLLVNDIMAQKKSHKIYNIRRQSMFKIVTDSTADLPAEYLQEHDLGCINLSYIMDGVTYGQGQELPEKEFYALMRNGKMPTTSQVNPEEAKNHFLKYLKENKEILCIAFFFWIERYL